MMVARKIGKLYPLFDVLRLMKTVKPLGARQAITFYTAPLRWLASLGRVSYYDVLPPLLVVSSGYGLFCTHARTQYQPAIPGGLRGRAHTTKPHRQGYSVRRCGGLHGPLHGIRL